MKSLTSIALISVFALTACGGPDPGPQQPEEPAAERAQPAGQAGQPAEAAAPSGEPEEIVPGLSMRVLEAGEGETAQPGQMAVVHYTGWLYDENAQDNRGQKFDSSRDRGQHFEFPLGGGRVIRGWDQGVVGMEVGEVRELTIAPELAYGERGAGDVIPPNAALVFEVELVELKPAG